MSSELFDTDVELNDITGLRQATENPQNSPPTLNKEENPSQVGESKKDPQNQEGGSSRKNQKQTESGSQREQLAAHYNGLNSKRRYV